MDAVIKNFDRLIAERASKEHWSLVQAVAPDVDKDMLLRHLTQKYSKVESTIHRDIAYLGKTTDYIELQRHPWNGEGKRLCTAGLTLAKNFSWLHAQTLIPRWLCIANTWTVRPLRMNRGRCKSGPSRWGFPSKRSGNTRKSTIRLFMCGWSMTFRRTTTAAVRTARDFRRHRFQDTPSSFGRRSTGSDRSTSGSTLGLYCTQRMCWKLNCFGPVGKVTRRMSR